MADAVKPNRYCRDCLHLAGILRQAIARCSIHRGCDCTDRCSDREPGGAAELLVDDLPLSGSATCRMHSFDPTDASGTSAECESVGPLRCVDRADGYGFLLLSDIEVHYIASDQRARSAIPLLRPFRDGLCLARQIAQADVAGD